LKGTLKNVYPHCCTCGVQVPLQFGAAFNAAAQHSWKSPAMRVAWDVLKVLLSTASVAGTHSLSSSVKQQLQQSGMLQQLAAVTTAMAADLQAEAAALAAGSGSAGGADVEQLVAATPHPDVTRVMLVHDQMISLWGRDAQAVSWLSDQSGLAAAAMQLLTAGLQHVSAVVQHVQQAASQQADTLLQRLSKKFQEGPMKKLWVNLCVSLGAALQQEQDGELQQLLQSSQMLHCVTAMLVTDAIALRRSISTGSYGAQGSSRCRCSTERRQRQQQDASSSSSNSSSSNEAAGELQLLQLLGLAPEVVTWMEQLGSLDVTVSKLAMVGQFHISRCEAAADLASQRETSTAGQHQRRWQYEQQLGLLLPTVLLPCVSSMLSTTQELLRQSPFATGVQQLLEASSMSLSLFLNLCDTHVTPAASLPTAWVQQLLGAVLQLADQLRYQQPLPQQQPPTPAGTAAAAAAATTARSNAQVTETGRNSSSSSSSGSASAPGSSTPGPTSNNSSSSLPEPLPEPTSTCARHLLQLLSVVAQLSWELRPTPSSNDHSSSDNNSQCNSSNSPAGIAAAVAAADPLVAAKLVEVGAAYEVVLRTLAAAHQNGTNSSLLGMEVGSWASRLLLNFRYGNVIAAQSDEAGWHMNLCGPVALLQEQRQLYSLLSTVLKVGSRRTTEGQLCWSVQTPGRCCLAAAHAAVGLLQAASARGEQCQSAASAAAQLSAVEYLPSLVIFGRCCLQWAEQLQQLAPVLPVLASGAPLQQQQVDALLHECSAALVCVPVVRQAVHAPVVDTLESLIATVSGWLGEGELPVAAGCAPRLLQQQLDALLSAQQGTQHEITDASLAALVQQLQGTGAMLCNTAVPHFCNNPACGNISGPTEVQLVSGRSCICAGCRTARYCGRDCQRVAWKQHKPVCKALAAAAGAASES
jgi:hypothetical protein